MEKKIAIYFLLSWMTYIFTVLNIGGISVSLILLLPLITIALNKNFKLPKHSIVGLLLLFLPVFYSALIITFTNGSTYSTLSHLIQSTICILTFFVFSGLNYNKFIPQLSYYSYVFLWITCIYGSYQFFARTYHLPLDFLPITNLQIASDFGYQRGYGNIYEHNYIFTRISSFFSEPSEFGRFVILLLPFSLSYKKSIPLILLALINIILMQSLGTIVVFIVLLFSWYVLTEGFNKVVLSIVKISVLISPFVLMLFFIEKESLGSLDRIFKIYDMGWSYLDQTERFQDTLSIANIISEKFILGYGLGSIGNFADNYVVANLFFLINLEKGIIGVIMFVMFILYPIFVLNKKSQNYRIGTYLSICQFLFMLNFSMLYFIPLYAITGFTYSLLTFRPKEC
ncbi:Polysaccharide polymerase [Vibrio chagasii]|nr:Polysaccharide polymerase [Vibrio chagasii]CAH7177066.1 Polysaccharide polymerase [Vibrio chagasii]CAH7243837.1 Polysaccharide polymerase [Vibrio chagasii]CAH7376942.1 Polysaccharide polymerase [Vibrio chagasii]